MRNPWLDIEHDHDWLPVLNGTEENCGLCFVRRKVTKGEPMVKKKVEVKVVEPEEVVEQPQEVEHVVNHEDRRDSGTNWLKSDKLPSLDDQTGRSNN